MIDTNVILSAILNRDSLPSKVLLFVSENEELALCQTILDECYAVAKRRFPSKIGVLKRLFSQMRFELLPDAVSEYLIIRDKHDQPILDCAIENQIDILISGDHHFLETNCRKPKIMSPVEFFHEYIERSSR